MTTHDLAALRAAIERVRTALAGPDAGRLVVVGDVMLDRYVDGVTTRLSPEAPVPVVDVHAELDRLGGAANVAAGLASLGASVVLIGLVGDDEASSRVRSLLEVVPGIEARLVVVTGRPTTTKERVRVDGRHIMRIDREVATEPDPAIRAAVERATRDALVGADALVLSDYAKGTVAPGLLAAISDRPCTIVDPKHLDVERYRGADVLAPNRAEAIATASLPIDAEPPSLDVAIARLHARLPATSVVVTCGADGVVWSEHGTEGAPLSQLPTLARRVVDVTGAGDSVVCGLAVALAEGADLPTAIAVASAIAAVAVESPGTATPTWDQVGALLGDR